MSPEDRRQYVNAFERTARFRRGDYSLPNIDDIWVLREHEEIVRNKERLASFNIKHKLWMNS